MKDELIHINKSIAAGIAIGIGGTAYLATGNPWIFPIGLFMVCYFGLNLFTGKVCYVLDSVKFPGLISMWFFNTLAAYLTGLVIAACKPGLVEKARGMVEVKLNESFSIIPLAFLCNVLIFVAVDTYRISDTVYPKGYKGLILPIGLIFATATFVACGFEHCIANAFYFGVAGEFSGSALLFLLANTIWNLIGGVAAKELLFKKYN